MKTSKTGTLYKILRVCLSVHSFCFSFPTGSHTGDQRGHVPRAISGRLKCGRLHEVLVKPFRICSPDIVYPPW